MLREDVEHDAAVARSARRAWRYALAFYLALLAFSTHWPGFGPAGSSHVDKSLHFICFGVLAWCFLNASPFRRPIFNFGLALGVVYVDESLQLIKWFGRTFSWYDIVAGWTGCVVAGLLWCALRLRAPPASADRLLDLTAERLLYSSHSEWLRALATTASCAALFAVVAWVHGELARSGPQPLSRLIYPAVLGGLAGAVLATALGLLRARARVTVGAGGSNTNQRGAIGVLKTARLAGTLLLPLLVGGAVVLPAESLVAGAERAMFGAISAGVTRADAEGFLILRPLLATSLAMVAAVAAASVLSRWRRASL